MRGMTATSVRLTKTHMAPSAGQTNSIHAQRRIGSRNLCVIIHNFWAAHRAHMAGSMKTRAEVFRLFSEVSSPRVHSLAGSRTRIAPVPSAYAHSPSAPPPLHRRNSESDVASTSPRLGRVSTDNLRGLEAEASAASQAPSTSLQWHSRLHLESEGVEQFTLNSSGEFFLVRKTEQSRQKHNIVSHGSITLPVGVGPETFQVERQVFDGQHLVEAHATWGPASAPVARLSVCSAKIASSRYDWCKVRPP